MTWSIGFRSPQQGELAREILLGLADEAFDGVGEALYRDPKQSAVSAPAAMPAALGDFAREAIAQALKDPHLVDSLLGEYLTEPKPNVWFDEPERPQVISSGVRLDRRTRMMFDAQHVFINGESYVASGRDAVIIRKLANTRLLAASDLKKASVQARALVQSWASAGWLHAL